MSSAHVRTIPSTKKMSLTEKGGGRSMEMDVAASEYAGE